MSRNTENTERFREIMGEIRELAEEALAIVRDEAEDEYDAAHSYWYAHLLGCVDDENSGFVGGGPMVDMAETYRNMVAPECEVCGEVIDGRNVPEGTRTEDGGAVCRHCAEAGRHPGMNQRWYCNGAFITTPQQKRRATSD